MVKKPVCHHHCCPPYHHLHRRVVCDCRHVCGAVRLVVRHVEGARSRGPICDRCVRLRSLQRLAHHRDQGVEMVPIATPERTAKRDLFDSSRLCGQERHRVVVGRQRTRAHGARRGHRQHDCHPRVAPPRERGVPFHIGF